MEETLTQKSRRRGNADAAIAMLKVAIIKACHHNSWKNGAFGSLKRETGDVDFDLERLEVYHRTTDTERAVFRETRTRVADLRAYLAGQPTDLSSVDDLGWVKTLKNLFENGTVQQQGSGEASTAAKGAPGTKPVPSKKEEVDEDGFERQKVYGGSGGPPKD